MFLFAFAVLGTQAATVATVDGTGYETLEAAIAAAEPVDGVVTYEICGKAEVSATGWIQVLKSGLSNVKKVAFVGTTKDAEICIAGGLAILADQQYDIDVSFRNLKLSKPNPKYGGDYGHSTNYFTTWLRNTGAAENTVTYENCTFPNGACNNQYGKTVYTNCTFANGTTGLYNLWIYGGSVEMDGGVFTGTRGMKVYTEGTPATAPSVEVKGTAFSGLTEKAAIVVSKAATVKFAEVSVADCPKGLFQKDIEGSSDDQKVTVTANGSKISGSFAITANREPETAKTEFNITGGMFTAEVPSDYCADGFTVKATTDADGNTVYGVVEKTELVNYVTLELVFGDNVADEDVVAAKALYAQEKYETCKAANEAYMALFGVTWGKGYLDVTDNTAPLYKYAGRSGSVSEVRFYIHGTLAGFTSLQSSGNQIDCTVGGNHQISRTSYSIIGVDGADGKAKLTDGNVQAYVAGGYASMFTASGKLTIDNIEFTSTTSTTVGASATRATESDTENEVASAEMEIKNCTFRGRLYVYDNFENQGKMTYSIHNCVFDGSNYSGDSNAYAIFAQCKGGNNLVIKDNAIAGFARGINIDHANVHATIEGNTISVTDTGRSCIQLSSLATANIVGNTLELTGGNAITLHEKLLTLGVVPVVSISGNTVTGTGYLIYDDAKANDKEFTSDNLKLTYATDNTVAATVDTTQGVKDATKYELSGTVATTLHSVDFAAFVKALTDAGYTFDGSKHARAQNGKLTVKWSPVSGCYDKRGEGHDCTVGNVIATANTPKRVNSGLTQFQLFEGESHAVNVKNVAFVYEPAAFTVCENSKWGGTFTAEKAPAGQIYLMNTGDVTFEDCSFDKVVLTSFNCTGTSTVKDCSFKNVYNSYAVKDIRGAKVAVTGCTFENCGAAVMVSSTVKVEEVTISDNTFKNVDVVGTTPADKVGTRGLVQIASLGNYAETAFDFSGNTATDCGPVLRQLNSTVSFDPDDKTNLGKLVSDGGASTFYTDDTFVAQVGDTKYATLAEAFAAFSAENHTLTLLKDAAWDATTPVYWAAGTQSGYAATLTDALTAAYKANEGAITIVCRPGADVGEMTHGHVADDLTIYGNDAYLSGGECDLEVDTYTFSRATGKQATDGAYLAKDITITAYELDNLGVWGERHTANKVTVNLTDCDGKALEGKTNVQRVYISGTTGVNNITLTGCDFLTKATAVYSNADGAIKAVNCSFTGGQVPFNINHKANGTQTVAVENCTFTNCGDAGDWKQFAAPLRLVNSGAGTQSAVVTGCAFAGTVGANGDILLGDGRTGEASNDVELKVVNTAANIQAQKPGYYGVETVDATKKATAASPAEGTLETSVAKLLPVNDGSEAHPYSREQFAAMTRAEYIAAQERLGGTLYVNVGDYAYEKDGVLGNGVRNDTPGQVPDHAKLNAYGENGYLGEKNDGANGQTVVFVGGTITSGVTGYTSIDNIGTSLLLAVPAYTKVTFKGTAFKNVLSFDYQLYTSPWSQLGGLTFNGCTFDGIIVGAIAAQELAFNGCTFNNYVNTTDANSSNPTWIRPAYGNWTKGDNEGQGTDFRSLTKITFENNTVTSTRPVKFERIAQWEMETTVRATDNAFDITPQEGDTSPKNVGLYFGANAKFDLVADNNTKSDGTAALYTAAYKAPNGTDYDGLPAGSTVKNAAGEDVTIDDARVWKKTDTLTLKTTTEVASVTNAKGVSVNFATLADAIAAAQDGETVKLLADVTVAGQLVVEKALTLDLGGKTVTSTYANGGYAFLTRAAVTVKNGTFAAGQARALSAYANLTLEDATITSELAGGNCCVAFSAANCVYTVVNTKIVGAYAIANFAHNATIAITGSTLEGSGCGLYHNGSNYGLKLTVSDTTINGAIDQAIGEGKDPSGVYLSGSSEAIANAANQNGAHGRHQATFTRCTIKGNTGVEVKYTDLTLEDCTVVATTKEPSYTQNNNGMAALGFAVVSTDNATGNATPKPEGTITITGADGSYTGLVGLGSLDSVKTGFADFEDAHYAVSGGTFSTAVLPEYCAAGFIPTANDDGTYGVKAGAYVAAIGTTGYETLEAALAAADAGATVKMLADVVLTEKQTIAKALVLDLNGKTISSTVNQFITIAKGGDLTVNDATGEGRIENTTTEFWGGTILMTGGVLTVNGGTLAANTATGAYSPVIEAKSSVTINVAGGRIEANRTGSVNAIQLGQNADATLNVTGGTIFGGKIGVYSYQCTGNVSVGNRVNVSGGEIIGKSGNAVYAAAKTGLSISGGTLTPGGTAAALAIGGGSTTASSCTVTVGREGGVVGDVTIPSIDFKPGYSANMATVNLLSGIVQKFLNFDRMTVATVSQGKDKLLVGTDITACLPGSELLCQLDAASGLYEIVKLTVENAAAIVTHNGVETLYRTVQQARTAVADDDTLTLKMDYTGSLGITKKNVTIDLGGKTLTGASNSHALSFNQSAAGDNTVTVKNGTIVAKGQDAACIRATSGDAATTLTLVLGDDLTLEVGSNNWSGKVVLDKGARTASPRAAVNNGGLLVTEDGTDWIYGETETAFTHAAGTEVTLLNDWYCTDYEGAVKVPDTSAFGSAKLNLDGHTIKHYGAGAAIVMGNDAKPSEGTAVKTLEISNGMIETSQYGAAVCGSNKSLTLDGVSVKTTGDDKLGIYANGMTSGNTVTLKNGSAVLSEKATGIYFPGAGTLTVEDSNVTGGVSGIEVRAGVLNVSGTSVIASTAMEFSFTNNDNGITTTGAAVAAVKHTVGNDLAVTITGGTFKGPRGFYANDPNVAKPGTVTVSISGGVFSTDVEKKYLADGCKTVQQTIDGTLYYVVGPAITQIGVTFGGVKKEMPFPDAWLVANIGADAATWTTEALEAKAENELAKWQCYLFGLDPNKKDAKVVATAGQGTDRAIPLAVANADASDSPLVTGGYVTVAYVLKGSNDRTVWTQVATSNKRDDLAIPLTGTTYKFYRVDVTVTSAEGN